jgi:SAM-dependent methyltransferase
LAPFLTQIIGIDVSDNMVGEFNRNAGLLGLQNKAVGHKADLLADKVPAEFAVPPYMDLDVLAVSMALHHFEHPDRALQQLGARLKKGGVCFIIDLVADSGHGHDHSHNHNHGHGEHEHEFGDAAHTVKSHGFSQQRMRELFQGAGFGDIEYKVLNQPLVFVKNGKTFSKPAFMARAQRV